MHNNVYFTWNQVTKFCNNIAIDLGEAEIDTIISIKIGGLIPSVLLSRKLKVQNIMLIDEHDLHDKLSFLFSKKRKVLIVTDLVTTGKTLMNIIMNSPVDVLSNQLLFCALVSTTDSKVRLNLPNLICGKELNDFKLVFFPWDM